MKFFYFLFLWICVLLKSAISELSFNPPKLCPNATWSDNAITFTNSTLVGFGAGTGGVFVTTKNSVFVANRESGRVIVYSQGSTIPTRIISNVATYPLSIFGRNNDDFYIDNGYSQNRVDKWGSNASNSTVAMYTCGSCYGIFVDINNNLHCSVYSKYEVIVKSLDNRMNIWSTEAGTGAVGSTSLTLNHPQGIHVDLSLNLYVADSENNRIQKFPFQQLNGTTVAGTGPSGTVGISLYRPVAVFVDADGYVFISDYYNHRIVGSGPYGFRCIVACSGIGAGSTQLSYPTGISFDTYGNLFVMDGHNSRVQKFNLKNNTCGPLTSTTTTTTTAMTTLAVTISYENIAVSYNQLAFSSNTTWNQSAITFATSSIVGTNPYGLFVDKNNTVYVPNRANSRVHIWTDGASMPTRNITTGLNAPFSVFATINGDVYIDNGYANSRVDKWSLNGMNSTVMFVKDECYDLFVDIASNIYCSMFSQHQVVTKTLDSNSSMWIIAAGTECAAAGSGPNQLNNPRGIYVDQDLNLYVADCGNNRVQKFFSQQTTAITVAGSTVNGTISLNCPSDVVLDNDGYLFIVDNNNNRIVGSSSNGFRCIVGCSGSGGLSATQLSNPALMSFDSYGNIFVTDYSNSRILKFMIIPVIRYNTTLSFNQPYLCPSTTWYLDGITFANSSLSGNRIIGIFIDRNNTVYMTHRQNGWVIIWYEGNNVSTRTIAGDMGEPLGIFVTAFNDLYVGNNLDTRVDKWSIDTNTSVRIMNVTNRCVFVFVDISNTLYCSMTNAHYVGKKLLDDSTSAFTIAAGNTSSGSGNSSLNQPNGVYVDINFNLYVADCGNDRVQKFLCGNRQATTIAGSGSLGTIALNCPSGIVFDANGYLFLTDQLNSRVIGSGPYGFRCLFGCDQIADSASNHLNRPRSLGFDSYGNLYVADQTNNRVQKFLLASNSCSLSYNEPELCVYLQWQQNATTIATTAQIGLLPIGIFVDGINTVYMPSRALNYTMILVQGNTSEKYIYTRTIQPLSIFVRINGDIYIDNGNYNGRVDKFASNISTPVMYINGSCYDLFVDLNNYLYCSLKLFHKIVKLLLNNSTTTPNAAAGTGSAGSASTMLNSPQGIYVDDSMNLYVADCSNNRVQMFQSGQLNGTTVIGTGSSSITIALNCPSDIVLDNQGYLFVVDSYNHRIVGSSLYGYRCIAGCSGVGSTASQLNLPQSMAFDSYGNLYVTDGANGRVQKFSIQKDCTPRAVTTTTTTTVDSTTSTTYSTTETTTSTTTTTITTTTIMTTTTTSTTTTTITTTTIMTTTTTTITTTTIMTTTTTTITTTTIMTTTTTTIMTTTTSTTTITTTTITTTTTSTTTTSTTTTTTISTATTTTKASTSTSTTTKASTSTSTTTITTTTTRITTTSTTSTSTITTASITATTSTSVTTISSSSSTTTKPITSTTTTITSAMSTTSTTTSTTTTTVSIMSIITTTVTTMISSSMTSITRSATSFETYPYQCPDNSIGSNCSYTSDPCLMVQPCSNSGTCHPNDTLPAGYECYCQNGYEGENCANDTRICKENTCWNNGSCVEVNKTTFKCECQEGSTGIYCELKIDLCKNISCENGGLCRMIDLEWKCFCLDSSLYYGNYCEHQTTALTVKKAVAKSFASVAITAITLTVSFVVLMDVLKYVFRIDPVKAVREEVKKSKNEAKSKPSKTVVRFQYIS